MPLRRVRDGYWVCNTRTEIENQYGGGLDFKSGDALTIIGGADSGGYVWDSTSSATPGAGTIQVVGETGRFLLVSATSASGLMTSSGSGTAVAFPASQRRIFHSDGTTSGGSWDALTETDVSNAIGDGAIEADKLKPSSVANQILKTVGGVTVWADETVTTLIPLVSSSDEGSIRDFPAGQRRIFHSDGVTDGGSWSALSSTDVATAFSDGSITVGKISTTGGTTGQVIKIVSGTAQWADDEVDISIPLVTSGAAGAENAFPSGQVRIHSSDGSTAGGSWAQLTSTEVGAAFAASSIATAKLVPGTNGQFLTVSGGAAAWASIPPASTVSSVAGGQVSAFPASQTRIFWSNGSTGGGQWAQLTSTETGSAFASASIAVSKLVPGTNGYVLTTASGVPTWTAPEFAITGAANGDLIRRAGGVWARYPILNTPNAPLLSISGLPAWSPLNTVPTVNIGSGSVSGVTVDMSTYGDNRAIYLDATGPVSLESINEVGFRQGPYVFINASDHLITVEPDSGSSGAGFILPTGIALELPPAHAMLAHYYGDGSLRDFFVMQIFDSGGLSELLIAGDVGEILAHDGDRWVRVPPAPATDYKLMSGGPSALPVWVHDNDGSTVVVRDGYSGDARNIFDNWADAWAAALAHGAPAKIYVEDTGSTVNIPGQVWDGEGRIGIYLANRTSSSSIQLSMASACEIQNITELVAVTTHPFDTFPVNIEVNGPTSANNTGVYLGDFRGLTFKYSGKFNWTGSRPYSIKVRNNHTVHMKELVHAGMGMHSNSDILLVVENQVTPPAMTSDSGTALLRVRQLAGSPAAAFTWAGSGGIIITKADNVESLSFTPANATHWPEGAPTEPKDGLDKLAARNPGQLPPGANLAHNKWSVFGKNTEGLSFDPAAEGAAVWVPGYNHWLYLGFLSTISETDHRSLACGGSQRSMHNLAHQGWWEFQAGSDTISSNFKRPFSVIVIPNEGSPRVVTSAQLVTAGILCVATSDDGGDTWTLRNGHFSSSTSGYRDMVWTGTHIIGIGAASGASVGRSPDGITWSSSAVSSATRVKLVTNGSGIVLAFTSSGAIDRSANHGSSWSTGSIPGFGTLHDAIYFNGKFIVMSSFGTVYTSTDGATWSSATPFVVEHPGKVSFLPYGYAYRSLVKCGGVLFGLFRGSYDSFTIANIFYSLDGINWRDGGVFTAFNVSTIDSSANRFSVHMASSSMNGTGNLYTDVHQIAGRLVGLQHNEWDSAADFFISPAILADMSGVT